MGPHGARAWFDLVRTQTPTGGPTLAEHLQASIALAAPVEVVYERLLQFEDYPDFVPGLREVRRLPRRRLLLVAEVGGVRHELKARILEQRRNRRLRVAVEERLNALAAVRFRRVGPEVTELHVSIDYRLDPLRARLVTLLADPQHHLEAGLESFRSHVADTAPATSD